MRLINLSKHEHSCNILHIFSDCSTITNHCICATNFEYLHKPDHLIQCLAIGKRKCFHCQRYKCMNKAYDTVTASTKLILIAAALGKFELLKYLYQNGCSLESKTGLFELRPLHLAIVHGHFNIFCYLLTQKVDVNAAILSHGTTYSPLMMAVIHKQDDMVKYLLMTKEINVSYRNSLLQSPVMFAVQNNSLDLVNLLLSNEDSRTLKRKASDTRHRIRRRIHHPGALLEALKQGKYTLATTRDFQQCGILTSEISDEPVQPPFKLRNSKRCSVGILTRLEYSSD